MPKLRKEKRDEVIKLLKQGYIIGEVAEKTGISRNTVSKINESIMQQDETKKQEPTEPDALSVVSIQKLRNIQGLYGYKTLDETVNQIFEDVTTIMPIKCEYELGFTKTISEVFKEISEDYKSNKKAISIISNAKNNDSIQRFILKTWNVDPAVFAFHDISCAVGFEGTIIDLMSKAVIESYKERGWKIEYYYNKELDEKMPILIDSRGIEYKFP